MGRAQFERVIAAAQREKLRAVASLPNNAILAGASEQVSFYAAPGTVGAVKSLFVSLFAPIGAASGTHGISVGFVLPTINQLVGTAAFNQKITLTGVAWDPAAPLSSQIPPDAGSVAQAIMGLAFDDTTPLAVTYVNNTNVNLGTAVRQYRVWMMERTVR